MPFLSSTTTTTTTTTILFFDLKLQLLIYLTFSMTEGEFSSSMERKRRMNCVAPLLS
jgi:hypothetical protein